MTVNAAFCPAALAADRAPVVGLSALAPAVRPLVRRGDADKLVFAGAETGDFLFGVNAGGLLVALFEYPSRLESPSKGCPAAEAAQAALDEAGSATGALQVLLRLLGRGFVCSARGRQAAFLLACADELLLLETANELWAWRALDDLGAVCSDWFLAGKHKLAHPDAAGHPAAKNGALDFGAAFGRKNAGSLRRLSATQVLYTLANGRPVPDWRSVLLGGDAKTDPAEGVDFITMRQVLAQSDPARPAAESMSVDPLAAKDLCTAGAAVFLPRSRVLWFTSGAVPHRALYTAVSLDALPDVTPAQSQAEWLEWEIVRRSAALGGLSDRSYVEALTDAQERIDRLPRRDSLTADSAAIEQQVRRSLLEQCRPLSESLPLRPLRRARARRENEAVLRQLQALSARQG